MGKSLRVCLMVTLMAIAAVPAFAQVTTSSVIGSVVGEDGRPLAGAQVVAVHQPSGTRYGTLSRADGRFLIPGMRIGGPYTVTASMIGFQSQAREGISLTLGVASDVAFVLATSAVQLEGITATVDQGGILSSDRTGAATSVSREQLTVVPTITGRLESIARLSPQFSGTFSFAGQDPRLNSITVDGSYFQNSFGLGNTPGDRTGVAPISLAAIEQVQVNVAPFDVRQGNFIGAGVNTVTRSGTNEFRGELYTQFRDENFVGTRAGSNDFDPGVFNFRQFGGWVSGPILQNKLFFFTSLESDALTEPGTTFRSNAGGETVGGGTTRVLRRDLEQLSTFLSSNFNYQTGPFEGYDHETPALRFLTRVDYNVNDRNKLSVRYTHLNSDTDVLLSNSSSLGWGTRRTNTTGLNFQNSNYQILENIRSVVGEWNSMIGDNMSNSLILGYRSADESRASRGDVFPMVDVLDAGSVYTTFGFEPFTPNNELRYNSFQLQNAFTRFAGSHTLTFGLSAERYESENVFFPGSQSAYVYNSLQDFYTDANDHLRNPNRTVSPVTLRRFQVRWANIPGMEKPVQPLEVLYAGVFAQDEWQVNDRLRLTLGARIDVPRFGETGIENPQVSGMTFRDEFGTAVQFNTAKLPDANPVFSPRVGFNFDVLGDRTTQLRGGTGIFTGPPAYVWVSNQIGENGMLTGFEQLENTTARPFHPDPNRYKPANVSGLPAASYGLAITDNDYRFPQLWRTNIAADQRLPFDVIATAELIYNQDVNGTYYINANLREPTGNFAGADNRPRWVGSNRINSNITSAIVLKNQNEGRSWIASGSLERPFGDGIFAKLGYSYGEARNTVDPGSIAFGSWNNNQHSGNPNRPGLGYSQYTPGERIFGLASIRREYLRAGATTISLFGERRHSVFSSPAGPVSTFSYTFAGDVNGDGGTSNDLIYIHQNASEMNFQAFTAGGRTFSAADQAAAWDAYIAQDPYLSRNRGGYAERNAVFTPMVFRADLSITQELFANVAGRRNALQIRADVLNFGNLLNSSWGVGKRPVNAQPLIVPTAAQGGPADAQGRMQYRMRVVDGELMKTTFEPTSTIFDVYRIQLGLRYLFN
jgi:hypothetical protein